MTQNEIYDLIIVGGGPGDPELITLRAERLIRGTKVVCAPRAAEGSESFALSIVSGIIDTSAQKVMTSGASSTISCSK